MKLILLLCSFVLGVLPMSAEEKSKEIFNHLGVNVGVGTEGISMGVATTLTPYVELGLGLNVMPGININEDIDVGTISYGSYTLPVNQIDTRFGIGRTTVDFKANCYPFGRRSSFFVAAGFSFGGKKLVKATGHSDQLEQYIAQNPSLKGDLVAEIDKYRFVIDEHGSVNGAIEVSGFRPYLGLGFGRLVPKHRVGCRFEMGCHFHGSPKLTQDGKDVMTGSGDDHDDFFSKVVKNVTVYPVLKFSLTGRIL